MPVAKVEDAFTKSEKFAARHRGVSASANAVRLGMTGMVSAWARLAVTVPP